MLRYNFHQLASNALSTLFIILFCSVFYRTVLVFQMDSWSAETVISVPAKKVEGWALPEMPGKEYES